MKLNKVIALLRDENIDLRERIIDVETDYVTLNDSYRHFITVMYRINRKIIQKKHFNKRNCTCIGKKNALKISQRRPEYLS